MKIFPRRGSLVIKIAVPVTVLVLSGAAAAVWIDITRTQALYFSEKERRIGTLLNAAFITVKNPLAGENVRYVRERMEKIAAANNEILDCIVTDEEGTVIYSLAPGRNGAKFGAAMFFPGYRYMKKEVSDGGRTFGSIYLGYETKGIFEDQRAMEIVAFTRIMAENLREVFRKRLYASVKVTAEDMTRGLEDIRYCLVEHSSGQVLYEAHAEGKAAPAGASDPEGPEETEGGAGHPVRVRMLKDAETGEELLDVTALIQDDSATYGSVRIGYSLDGLRKSVRRTRMQVLYICLIFSAASVLFSLLVARRISRPVIYLSQAARNVGRGRLDQVVQVKTGGDELVSLADSFNEMIRGLKEKEFVKEIFSKYVSRQVAEEILKNPGKLSPGGKEQKVTVLFSDIRGFTSFAERHEPEKVVSRLNEYFSAMIDVIFEHEGTLDKYIGDAIMAVFGIPFVHEDDALRCVKTALAMQAALEKLNEGWRKRGEEEIGTGIGINTGKVIVGNLGDLRRLEYTVIGDNVNIASRLESLTKDYKCNIIISGATYREVEKRVEARRLESARVKGKTSAVEIYELLGMK